MEQHLQTLWATTLGIDAGSIGRDNSFFQIGGDSVGAMRLVSAARQHGLSFTVANVFRLPRLCDLATAIEEIDVPPELQQASGTIRPFSLINEDLGRVSAQVQAAALCGMPPRLVADVFPCTTFQEGLLTSTAHDTGDYVARYVFQLQPELDTDRFRTAWEVVVAKTPILWTRVVDLRGDGLVQVSWTSH